MEVLPVDSKPFSLQLLWMGDESDDALWGKKCNGSHTQNCRAHKASDTFLHLDLWLTKYLPSSCSFILEYLGLRCYRQQFSHCLDFVVLSINARHFTCVWSWGCLGTDLIHISLVSCSGHQSAETKAPFQSRLFMPNQMHQSCLKNHEGNVQAISLFYCCVQEDLYSRNQYSSLLYFSVDFTLFTTTRWKLPFLD